MMDFPTAAAQLLLNPISWPMIFAALAISVSIAALSYMAGELFSMPSLKGFSKLELQELGVSVAIILLALMLITPGGPFDMVAQGFAYSGPAVTSGPFGEETSTASGYCPEWEEIHCSSGNCEHIAFGKADYFLGCRLTGPAMGEAFVEFIRPTLAGSPIIIDGYYMRPGKGIMMPRVMQGYIDLTWNEVLLGVLSTFDLALYFKLGGILWITVGGIMPLTGLSLISEANIMVADALMTVWSAYAAQKMLLSFVESSVLVYFLPLGLLMRAFPFSRKTGSTIIALVFAAYFIFPLSILVNEQVFYMINNPSGEAGCAASGTACADNSECCSLDCRAGKCADVLTDFSEYESVFQVCNEDPMSQEFFTGSGGQTEENAEAMQQYINDLNDANEVTGAPTRADERLRQEAEEVERQGGVTTAAISSAQTIIFGNMGDAIAEFFTVFQVSMMDVSKYIVLTIFFVVLEIVVTMTLMKDFAVLIGGEPRVFGLSKLV